MSPKSCCPCRVWPWSATVLLGLAACSLNPELPPSTVRPGAATSTPDGVAVESAGGAAGTSDGATSVDLGAEAATNRGGGGSGAAVGTSISGASGSVGPSHTAGGVAGALHAVGGTAGNSTTISRAGSSGRGGASGLGASSSSQDAGTGAGTGGSSATHLLLFSEYVEGSSSYKALEIAATERAALDGCKVEVYYNGKGEPTTSLTLAGTLEPNGVWVICTSALAALVGNVCNQTALLSFNGNDAIALVCEGEFVDAFGQIGIDPGTSWGNAEVETLDRTLRRACSVTHGDAEGLDAFDPASEWTAAPTDTFDGLGTRGCAG